MFTDRRDAGRKLAVKLSGFAGRKDVLILALPRGGVPVAYEGAKVLDVSMDIFLVRKLGTPGYPELAMGAVASGGIRVMNEDVVAAYSISNEVVEDIYRAEMEELQRRERAYRGERPPPDVEGHTLILVDDGLATGASMRAAVKTLETRDPARIVVAVPTGPVEVCDSFQQEGIDIFCLTTPEPFFGVGGSYENFDQISDREVRSIIEEYHDLVSRRKDR